MGANWGPQVDKKLIVIFYARMALAQVQMHYTMIDELLVVVYALERFQPYILGSKIIIHTDHASLKYFLSNKELKP